MRRIDPLVGLGLAFTCLLWTAAPRFSLAQTMVFPSMPTVIMVPLPPYDPSGAEPVGQPRDL